MRLQVPNKEEMAWQHGAGASPVPHRAAPAMSPDPFVWFWRCDSIQAPRRTSERRSKAWLQGLDRPEQRQPLGFELGSSPRCCQSPQRCLQSPKPVGRELPPDPVAS